MAAAKNLVIVESPGKIKSISKFLGKDYTVMASFGHVRDLPKSKMGIDTEGDFKPQYLVPKDKSKVIKELKAKINDKTIVWIATDEDREGEAIGWHLAHALKVASSPNLRRIVFHEITKNAILESIENPRKINQKLVDAQQARRVLDRLVGYELSPLLWKKIRYGLSAGRVQSVAVRLICEREREIQAFVPEEYWTLTAHMKSKADAAFVAKLMKHKGENIKPGSEKEMNKVLADLKGADYEITKVEKKEVKRNPAPPFTTSTLQQEAARKLGFSVKKTMMLAQKLYEGLDIGSGHEGLITYMRTDSVNLSQTALKQAKDVVTDMYGKEFALEKPRFYKSGKAAQEAHEAIRPTVLTRTPESIEKYLEKDLLKLYDLIWKRTVACQMAQAIMDKTAVDIEANDYLFRANGQVVKFAGFMQVYMEGRDDEAEEKEDEEALLPALAVGEKPKCNKLDPKQHFTKPPARYTEASLVKKLESEGIGRPSTYAPTISTVQARGYIEKDGRQLFPTETGFLVNDFLVKHFPNILDLHFTVKMEQMLDEVAEGKETWQEEIKEFYQPFSKLVKDKEENVTKEEASQARKLGVDQKTGKEVSVRIGRYGPYVQLGTKDDEEKPKFASLPEELNMHEVEMKDVMHLFELPRLLGQTPEGEDIETNVGRFGPYVKIGKTYYSIKDDDPYTITLERAMEVVKAEKERKAKAVIQSFDKQGIQILDGRYGPYIKEGKKNYKIPKDKDPKKLTVEECEEIIDNAPKRTFRKKK